MPNVFHVPNEVSAKRLYVVTQMMPGQGLQPNYRLQATMDIKPQNAALKRTEEATGGFDRFVRPNRGTITYGGTIGGGLTFENAPLYMRWLLKGGGTPTGSNGVYTYAQAPSFDIDDIDVFTALYGPPGLIMYSRDVQLDEATISMDLDAQEGSWQISGTVVAANSDPAPGTADGVATSGSTTEVTMTGAGWVANAYVGAYVFINPNTPNAEVRAITENTTDKLTLSNALPSAVTASTKFRIAGQFPAGVQMPQEHAIPTETTDVYVDPVGSIGTTKVNGRVIMASVTVQNNRYAKSFMGSDRTKNTGRTGRRGRVVTGQLRVEFDQWYEYDRWKAMDKLAIRFKSEGDKLAGGNTKELAQIDVLAAVLDEFSDQEREANLTRTFGFVGHLPASGSVIETTWINGVATLA